LQQQLVELRLERAELQALRPREQVDRQLSPERGVTSIASITGSARIARPKPWL
jgi:hypothetical protein